MFAQALLASTPLKKGSTFSIVETLQQAELRRLEEKSIPKEPPSIESILTMEIQEFAQNPACHEMLFNKANAVCDDTNGIFQYLLKKMPVQGQVQVKGSNAEEMAKSIVLKEDHIFSEKQKQSAPEKNTQFFCR